MKPTMDLESQRLALQAALDAAKKPAERNKLGQFATPTALARDLVAHALTLLEPNERIRFLDPAIGTGSFFSALQHLSEPHRLESATGFEIDPHYGEPARSLWQQTPLRLGIADFTTQIPCANGVNLLISNPPYVRHHHLDADTKARLHVLSEQASGMNLSGLAGLYTHFMALAHAWMAPGAIACWLIPSEFMDVNYGREVKRYLLEQVTLLRIHRFDPADAQFDDALVSSTVVWFRNTPPPEQHRTSFTYGGTHSTPHQVREVASLALRNAPKWTRFPENEAVERDHQIPRLKDLFDIRRGIATGDNAFFILSPEKASALDLPASQLTPILPSPRYLSSNVIEADASGMPEIERPLFLLDCRLPEYMVRERFPSLWKYLESGREEMLKRYICSHRPLWYVQENRPAAPFLCTYMGRSDGADARPFRFILNRSRAVVANSYLNLYPKPLVAQKLQREPHLREQVWKALNELQPSSMVAEGRVYGGGLHKMEPKELAQVPAAELASLLNLDEEPSFLFDSLEAA